MLQSNASTLPKAPVQETNRQSVALYEDMRRQFERDGHSAPKGKGGSSAGPCERNNIYAVRDYKIADLDKGASTVSFKKRKHDFEVLVATIGPSWSGVTSLLRHYRLYEDGEFDAEALESVAALATKAEKRKPTINLFLLNLMRKSMRFTNRSCLVFLSISLPSSDRQAASRTASSSSGSLSANSIQRAPIMPSIS